MSVSWDEVYVAVGLAKQDWYKSCPNAYSRT